VDAHSEARLEEVHQELARRVRQLASLLSFELRVTQGLRSWAMQDALYQQGRSTPGAIVTNARPEHSAHCFLYAVDVAPSDDKGGIDWNGKDAKWEELLAKAPSCGLAEGGTWRMFPDEPHIYLQELPATPDQEMVYVFREGGLEAVRNLIDERLKGSTT
jgi:peptidoglycan LD-endopeptidase CwlK